MGAFTKIFQRLKLTADTNVSTQTTTVIAADTTNSSIAIVPNGTGALVAAIPDGTATGGNARGANAVDLQPSRGNSLQVASGARSVIVGGDSNKATAGNCVIVGGSGNSNGGTQSFIGAGNTNTIAPGVTENVIVGGALNNIFGSGAYGFIGSGFSNALSSQYGVISGGQNNTASTNTHATVLGGLSNTASGQYSIAGGKSMVASGRNSIALGGLNSGSTASGQCSVVLGGEGNLASNFNCVAIGEGNTAIGVTSIALGQNNTASSNYSTVSGGQSNTASTGTHATVVGGQSNTASGSGAIAGGLSCTASGQHSFAAGREGTQALGQTSFAFGRSCIAQEKNSISTGEGARAYLFGMRSHSGIGGFTNNVESQISDLIASKLAALNSGATTILSLDGTGVTNLIIPYGTNRVWAVKVVATAVVSVAGGTLVLGDSYMGEYTLLFKKVGGVSSVVGVAAGNIIFDANMGSAAFTFAAGASQDLQITFKAPTTASATTFRCVARVELTEVAY